MSIKISTNPSKDNIRVGYIDPKLGYVDNVTIPEANVYAKNNPRTTFIFSDGDNVLNYLNINQVNELSGNDLLSTKECEGIKNKKIRNANGDGDGDDDDNGNALSTPVIQFSGGGGVGAIANPVIGTDGSILSVDLIYGGNGYQYPPVVSADDFSGFGSGAVFEVELGEIAETILDCDGFDDIEEYDISDKDDPDLGRIYGQNGNDLGKWNPRSYLITQENSSSIQVEEYVRLLDAQNRTPFWTTRTRTPDRAHSDSDRFIVSKIYDDSDSRWDPFLSNYGISPIPRSRVPGSDYAGITFIMEWDENFPYDGEYVFRGLADNFGTLYIDGDIVGDLGSLSGPVQPIKRKITGGIHTITLVILNAPAQTITTQSQAVRSEPSISQTTGSKSEPSKSQPSKSDKIEVAFTVYGQGGSTSGYSFTFTSADGKDTFTLRGVKKSKETRVDKIRLLPNVDYDVVGSSNHKDGRKIEQGIIERGRKRKEGGIGTSNKIFADGLGTKNDNDDMQVTCSLGIFTSSNRKKIGRSTYDLTFRVERK